MEADTTEGARTMNTNNKNAPLKRRVLDSIDSNALFSGGSSRRQIAELREIGISMNSRRNAVASFHPIRGIASAAIDEDDSGTYDPNEDHAKQASSQPKRVKKAKIAGDAAEGDATSKTGKTLELEHAGLVRFSFHSKGALKFLGSLPLGPFNDDSSDTDTIRGDNNSDTGTICRSMDASSTILSTKRKSTKPERLGEQENKNDPSATDKLVEDDPQRQGCKACFKSGHNDCSLIQDAYAYPCAECVDGGIDCELIVPPKLKKVCKRCKKKRISCSYKFDGGKGVDACNSCKELRVACCAGPLRASHAKRFRKLKEYETAAVPQAPLAPQTHATSSTLSASQIPIGDVADTPQVQVTAPARRFVACNQCRGEGLRCNLKRHQIGPCKECKLANETCEFVLVPAASQIPSNPASVPNGTARAKLTIKKKQIPRRRQPSNKRQKHLLKKGFKGKKKGAKGNARNAAQPPRPEPLEPRSTNGINHIVIRTSYAHPIIFNHDPAPNGSSPCHFCSQPFFGIFGHGWRNVEVIPLPNGHGYEEIGDAPRNVVRNFEGNAAGQNSNKSRSRDLRGHNQRGEPRSQMCFSCTSARVRIISCRAHNMKPLDGAFDPDTYSAQLNDFIAGGDIAGAQFILESKVCSICSRFAEHHCVSAQELCGFDCECDEDAMVCAKVGCGLRLCGTCMHFLDKIGVNKGFSTNDEDVDNGLDRLVRLAQMEVFHYEDGVRADAAFLTTEGELNQRFECGFGKVEILGDEAGKVEEGDENKIQSISSRKKILVKC